MLAPRTMHRLKTKIRLTVNTSPLEIIHHFLRPRVKHDPSIKNRRVLQLDLGSKQVPPVVDIGRREHGHDEGDDFGLTTVIQRRRFVDQETVFVGFTKPKNDIGDLRHDMTGCRVHQVERTGVIGFFKVVGFRETGFSHLLC